MKKWYRMNINNMNQFKNINKIKILNKKADIIRK